MAMNVGLDLAAADMPLRPDPAVRTRRRPATVGRAAFESVLQDEGDDYNRALRAYVSELIASGMDPETANRVAVSRMVQNRMENIPEGATADERTAAVGSGVELGINDPSALDLGGAGRPGPYDLAGRPGYDRTFTPQELAAQRGDDESPAPASFTLPGPRTLDGKPVRPPRALATQEDAARYKERGTDPETGRRTKSQYDLDMEARGYTAVMEPDGSVGYRTTYAPATDDPTGLGAIGRAGRRVDLERSTVPGTKDNRYEPREMMTPTGEMVQVWDTTEAGLAYTNQQAEQRTKHRLADRAGLGAEAEGMTADELRSAVRSKRTSEKQDRESAWRAQMMLGGGRPTGGPGGTKAATNALMMLPPEWQNAVLAKGLRPDLDGTTPLTVDANSAKNAMRLLNADIVGQGLMGDTRAQMAADARRQQAFEFARTEADKIVGGMFGSGQLSEEDARRIRRRVEARFPGMSGVVDALPIAEGGGAPGRPAVPTPALPAIPAPPTTPVGTGGIPYYPRTGM